MHRHVVWHVNVEKLRIEGRPAWCRNFEDAHIVKSALFRIEVFIHPVRCQKCVADHIGVGRIGDIDRIADRGSASAICADRALVRDRDIVNTFIKEGKNAIRWTRLSCRTFRNNAVRLQLHALAYNLGNFMRTLALPDAVEQWSLTTLKDKLIKIGAKVVRHGRYVTFQMAEVAIPRTLFADILRLIAQLRPPPDPAPA